MQAGLEKFNLGKISKAIKGSSLPMKNVALSATAALSEGRTEYMQGVVDTYASALAKGKTADEAGEETWAWMRSEEALESFVGGLFGGYGMSAAGRAYKKLNANIRKHTGGTAVASMRVGFIL